MSRAGRIAKVTLALAGAGAVFGAVAGAVSMGVAVAVMRGIPSALNVSGLLVTGLVGALMGLVLFPTAGWLLMRRVPIGRALLGTSLGTIAGGLVGAFVPGIQVSLYSPLIGGLIGFALAALVLRIGTRQPVEAQQRVRVA